jgi:hypothetical protein
MHNMSKPIFHAAFYVLDRSTEGLEPVLAGPFDDADSANTVKRNYRSAGLWGATTVYQRIIESDYEECSTVKIAFPARSHLGFFGLLLG